MTVELEGENTNRPASIACNSIDVGLIIYNERKIIGPTLTALLTAGFDHFVVLDMQSTDGTADYVRELLGDKAKIISFPRRSLIEYGYAHARNTCASFSTREWLLFVDADEVLIGGVENGSVIITNPGETPDIYSIVRNNLHFDTDNGPDAISVHSIENHSRLYKPSCRMYYSGYIHENIVLLGEPGYHICGQTALTFDHYSNLKDTADLMPKEELYALMLLRVYNQVDLRVGISPWWYNTYVPERLAFITAAATAFADQQGIDPSFYGPISLDIKRHKRIKNAIKAATRREESLSKLIKRVISKIYNLSKPFKI